MRKEETVYYNMLAPVVICWKMTKMRPLPYIRGRIRFQ